MVSILGINAIGEESGNETIGDAAALPWLQDTTEQGVWDSWQAEWRDVIVLDHDNVVVGSMNLTTESLDDEANRQTLRDLLAAAGAQ